ncbi:DPP IV N-terminal domain-containing protein [Polaribacter batillariae]|uniref:DPP IV N-terminal domain-containing protein n=1 Tax=Polaribacter batillariae TaxID=2808900 RepID=A0ABX7SX86_9FLAO|nr:DPP IV N-terminal domain-containing protein [Polaribacter batillariae]QTD38867.1 DPP IV N-terminal domain-containing protein [Polaribacter batillariae]
MEFKIFKITAITCCSLLMFCCSSEEKQKEFTIAEYEAAAKHMNRNLYRKVHNQVSGSSFVGENSVLYSTTNKEGKKFVLANANSKTKKDAFDHQKLAEALSKELDKEIKANKLPIYGVSMSKDLKTVSFSANRQQYIYNLSDNSISKKTSTTKRVNRNEHVSPNGKLAAYINDYNLWIRNLETGKKTQITFDGKEDYGYATNNAGWVKSDGAVLKWSPNSDKIATFQQDARGVGMMYLTSTNVGHPKLEAWKHPLPGDKKVFRIERVIIHLGNQPKTVRLKMKPDFQRGTTTDHIADWNNELLDAQWNKEGTLFAFVSGSRDHKIAHLQIADAFSGQVESIYKEEVDTYYESGVNAENWKVLFDSNEFIWYSEKTNWGHIYLYDLKTKELKNQITSGDWIVKQVKNIDEKNRQIYFTAGGKEEGNPYHNYYYKINFDGTNLINLTPSKGTHSVTFSDDYTLLVDIYSTTTNPPISVLRNGNGEKIMDLETADISELKANNWQEPIEFSVKARDEKTDIYGLMFLPSNYNEAKKYPVLNYIYPGPQSGSVGYYGFKPVWGDFQAVAELGFVVVAVDAMGTPMRSKSFHDAYYGNMGDNGLPDNITAIKQLAQKYKGMDIERVGIWGHSGGGFASTRAVFAYPDFYDVAVSGAGNHDNRNYEADWGEKWQGLLVNGKMEGKADGTTNYDNQANQLIAKNLKGKLLITHGSMDNNVPPSNTMLVVEALIKANKDFDMILFPNKRHGYGDMTNYMTRKRWDYFVTHLLNAKPAKGFQIK